MRGEDKLPTGGNLDNITADDMLVLLNKVISEKPAPKKKPDFKLEKNDVPLEIDDSVYDTAQNELHGSEALRVKDDSDLDVDELIEKFINAPKREREEKQSQELPLVDDSGEEIVKEYGQSDIEAARDAAAEIETVAETETAETAVETVIEEYFEDAVETVAEEAEENVSESEVPSELQDVRAEFEENTVEVPADDSDVDDSDVKIALEETHEVKAVAEADADPDGDEPVVDTGRTAVFDISLVKEIAGSAASKMGEDIFADSRTEVFTKIREEDLVNELSVEAVDAAIDESVEKLLNSEEDASAVVVEEPESVQAANAVRETVYGQLDDETIDQTDLNLMVALGMNEELVDAVGAEQATAIEDDIISKHVETAQMQEVESKREFTSYDQVREILIDYKNKYYILMGKIGAALLLMLGLFIYENYAMLGIEMPAFIRPSSYPVVYAMVDLQLVVLCGALAGKHIFDGVRGIIKLKPTAECLTAFTMLLSVLYTAAVCFVAPVGGFKLFNMPVALVCTLALVHDFLHLKRDIFSFNTVSSSKKKFVISPVSAETAALEHEAFEEFVPADSEIVRVGKADFVDGFFGRIEEKKVNKPFVGVVIPAVLALAVTFTVLGFVKTENAYDSFTLAFMTAMFTLPASAFAAYSYPFYKASKDAYESGSAIIGESSLTEYSSSAVISFEDKEVFPSAGVKVTSIKVYGNNRIDEIIYKLSSAFIKVGGPLADVFKQATHELGHSENVELVDVDDDGFTVSVDDVQTYIGKSTYMEKNDYDPPYDHDGRRQEQEGTVGVLYVAYGGQLAAKVYVRYTIDGEFEKILSHLNRTGLCVGIKSFDPNIDDLLLSRKIKTAKYPVKVIRSRTVEDIPHSVERSDSGIVSISSVKSLLRTVALCEKVGGVVKTNLMVKALSMLIGVVVMALIYAFGDTLEMSSLYITIYQFFWAILVVLVSRFLV